MPFAEVSVNSPIAQRKAFSYGIPAGLQPENRAGSLEYLSEPKLFRELSSN